MMILTVLDTSKMHNMLSIITSSILAVISLFYIYTVSSFFEVGIFPLHNRVTFALPFNNYVLNEQFDHYIIFACLIALLVLLIKSKKKSLLLVVILGSTFLIAIITNQEKIVEVFALVSIPIIVTLLFYNKYSKKKIIQDYAKFTLTFLAIIGLFLGVIGLIMSLGKIFSVPTEPIFVRDYSYDIFLVLSSFSTFYIVLLITCYPVKLLMKTGSKILHIDQLEKISKDRIRPRTKFIFLSSFIVLSLLITLIPHLETINSDNQQVSVDTGFYVNWVNATINTQSNSEFLKQVFVEQSDGDRPFSLLFILTITKITGYDLYTTVENLGFILAPLLVIVFYYLTRELVRNDTTALLASFLTAISFQTLIGIYAGFYANWLALIVGFVSLIFMLRFLRYSGKWNLFIYLTLSLSVLFSHVYTWGVLSVFSIAFLAIMFKVNRNSKRNISLLLLVILCTVAVDVVKMNLLESAGGFEKDIEKVDYLTDPNQFNIRWNNLTYTTFVFAGAQYANFLILLLVLYWLLRSDWKETSTIFIMIFLTVGSIAFFFGQSSLQLRFLYDVPFQIPAAIALTMIKKVNRGNIILVAICFWIMIMAIRSVANFYFVNPMS